MKGLAGVNGEKALTRGSMRCVRPQPLETDVYYICHIPGSHSLVSMDPGEDKEMFAKPLHAFWTSFLQFYSEVLPGQVVTSGTHHRCLIMPDAKGHGCFFMPTSGYQQTICVQASQGCSCHHHSQSHWPSPPSSLRMSFSFLGSPAS